MPVPYAMGTFTLPINPTLITSYVPTLYIFCNGNLSKKMYSIVT